MSEELMIRHCAPTLAGMKTGSLFSYAPEQGENIRDEIRSLNRRLSAKGLRVLPLCMQKQRVLIYVYRPGKLREDFAAEEIRALLAECGYCGGKPEQCVAALMRRLRSQGDFPHEIGLFLGYPPEDVIGFIRHKDCGCKCVGCWRVYGDVRKAETLFARYKRCTDQFLTAWKNGSTVEQLAVSA
ncbi:MAG: DUF3793 family protein [Oscillospiraceae bacterium]|nr:DUF3793 family protein [Oscillospiraceae bacterium]